MRDIYYFLVFLSAVQRLIELFYSRRNIARLREQGYVLGEQGSAFAVMVAVHTLWFISLVLEPLSSPQPPWPFAFAALVVFLAAQALRAWVLYTLGSHWNAQVMQPAAGLENKSIFCASGPYRYIRHPNYLAVLLEFASLPLIGGAWQTAVALSLANGIVLRRRMRRENELLDRRPGYREMMSGKPALLPRLSRA